MTAEYNAIQYNEEQYNYPLAPVVIPAFDWFQQPSALLRRPANIFLQAQTRADPVFVPPPIVIFDWFQQSANPIRPRLHLASGISVSPEQAIAPFGWLIPLAQQPIIEAARPLGHFALVELVVPEAPDIDWLREHEVVRRLPISIQIGFFALVELIIPPAPPVAEVSQQSVTLHTEVIRIPDRTEAY